MKLSFLGTNGWYANKMASTMCTLLETKDYYIVFDAGDSIYKLDKYIKKEKPIILFLSHLHIDHISGFHILSKFKFKQRLMIFCPKGTKKYLKKFIDHPFTVSLKQLSYKVLIKEIEAGRHNLPFPVECKKIAHIDLNFGFRVSVDKKIITYLCDTSLCENGKLLAKDADILIHECSMKKGIAFDLWGHVGPEGAALVAKQSGAHKLFLTHFSADAYLVEKDRLKAQNLARKTFKNTYFTEDDLSVDV